jgi:hypothetical protein
MHVVECDPDVILMSSLTSISERKIMHANGKHAVLRRLTLKDTNSIGMIDQDPLSTQPTKFLQKFTETEHSEIHKLKTLRYARRNNVLVVLCPRLEEWIIEASVRANINLERYNLPNSGSELHGIINFKLNRFRQLVGDLLRQSDRVKTLQAHLTEPI